MGPQDYGRGITAFGQLTTYGLGFRLLGLRVWDSALWMFITYGLRVYGLGLRASKAQGALSVGLRLIVYSEVLFWCVRGPEVSSGSGVYRANLNRGALSVLRDLDLAGRA